MSYRHLATSVSLLSGILCLTLIFIPQIVYWLFQLQGNDISNFLAKRAGVLFFGLTVVCFHSRNSQSGEAQALVALAIGLTMGAMALLGLFEFARGTAGAGILVAVAIESLIATLFFRHWSGVR